MTLCSRLTKVIRSMLMFEFTSLRTNVLSAPPEHTQTDAWCQTEFECVCFSLQCMCVVTEVRLHQLVCWGTDGVWSSSVCLAECALSDAEHNSFLLWSAVCQRESSRLPNTHTLICEKVTQAVCVLCVVLLYSLDAGCCDVVQHTCVESTNVWSQWVEFTAAQSVSTHTQILTDNQPNLNTQTHTHNQHNQHATSQVHVTQFTSDWTSQHLSDTFITISGSHSPFPEAIRDDSVSIFVTFHLVTSLGVAEREEEPKTCSRSSESPSG